jgi:hypothetical protein
MGSAQVHPHGKETLCRVRIRSLLFFTTFSLSQFFKPVFFSCKLDLSMALPMDSSKSLLMETSSSMQLQLAAIILTLSLERTGMWKVKFLSHLDDFMSMGISKFRVPVF